MKRITTLSLAVLAMVLLALAGCESDSGTTNNDTNVADSGYDVVDSGDVGDKDDTPNGVVCDETGWCCKGSACWQLQDTQDTDVIDGGDDVNVGPISCSGDEDCPEALVCSMKAGDICVECTENWNCANGDTCNIDTFTCQAGSLLDPFRWMEGDWKCTEGGFVDQTFQLELISWDATDQVVIAEGLPPFADYATWNFWYEGEILHGFAKSNDGELESKDFSYDPENKELHFTEFYPETGDIYNWAYQMLQ